jgi:hypothetical protein
VRLGTWIAFEQAAQLLAACLGVQVSEATARRQTEAAGAAYERVHRAAVERIEHEASPAGPGPDKQLVSVDGAMVPLVHGAWAEVKTLVVGVVGQPVRQGEEWVVHSGELSYFSRMLEAEAFSRQALVEIQRRGVENAGQVVAVMDGAEWEQRFVDFHCPRAVRILDFPHAAGRVSQIGEALWGEGQASTKSWLEQRLHQLKHEGPAALLAELRGLHDQHPDQAVLAENLAYLEKRAGHMQYPQYQAQGWPIGSGVVESANKVVVEARLKGAGKHWAPAHVNPMLALRNLVCNDRWAEGWVQIATQLRRQEAQRRLAAQQKRRQPVAAPASVQAEPATVTSAPVALRQSPDVTSSPPTGPMNQAPLPKPPYRPGPDHPWRHSGIGRARFKPYHRRESPKT